AGHWGAAARSFDRAMRDMPGDPDPPNNLAVALLKLGRDVARAESLATRAVRLAGPRDSLYRASLADARAARAAPSRRFPPHPPVTCHPCIVVRALPAAWEAMVRPTTRSPACLRIRAGWRSRPFC